jgi:hypothetical protein
MSKLLSTVLLGMYLMLKHILGLLSLRKTILMDFPSSSSAQLSHISPMITLFIQHLQSGSQDNFRTSSTVPCIPDAPKKIWCDDFCKADMDLYSHQAPEHPHLHCELAIWGRIGKPKPYTCSLWVWSRLYEPFMPKEMDRNNLFRLVPDTTPVGYTVFLWYRVIYCRQRLFLPPWPKQRCSTTYVCHFWGVSSKQTLLIVAKSCKMTCFDRITTSSTHHKKLEAGWNSRFSAVYET